ncbi:AbrB/MazE/SpoVT family DNA-binding domain-containing protein [Deinococcus sp. 12RED42]|uniref:AbrB/MazE/SpoVT family DNA-binding domain-containing protein n=1 Tax=Deinococcus sp. 12RED42 TaxID=2745872 RepID=UPI001E2DC8B1|nr:AbrB/MazE/SpoVT family DNA-binding domain-containing protein [Deinococcus sp. 12RED42]MCD0164716.1 AbrB/MazE/SpoVT family DNA-binding domain-containing protein [Deinococcus sp. 12RED42]
MTQIQYYNLKIQAQGRVAVPTAVRADLNVQEGDEVLLVKDAHGYHLTTRQALIEAATGSLARPDERDLTQEFLDDRSQDAAGKGW